MTNQKFIELIGEYLDEIKQIHGTSLRSKQATRELSYRPALDNFFRALSKTLNKKSIDIVFEPIKQKSGRPDWRFHHSESMAVFGYVEAKGFDAISPVDWKNHSKQLSKYLSIGHRVILTDGIDFLFFNPSDPTNPKSISIVKKPLRLDRVWLSKSLNEFQSALEEFFRDPKPRTVSDDALMIELAIRARNLSDDIMSVVSLNIGEGMDSLENKSILALKSLKQILQFEHDPHLHTDERFSETVSQVLIFGLFYAHRHLSTSKLTPKEIRKKIHEFWLMPIKNNGENNLRPFRALAEILESNRELSSLNTWYSDCTLLLSYINLSQKQRQSPNYHLLYEKFLIHFDPQDRIDFGAYASPNQLAQFMIIFSEIISRRVFHDSLFQAKNKIIDPCCGTGTFIEEILKFSSNRKIQKKNYPNIIGFEILAAPYALSQYRMLQLKSHECHNVNSVKIVLCNTLSDVITENSAGAINRKKNSSKSKTNKLLRDEMDEAIRLAKPPITLVIGNPPSSDAGLHTDKNTSKLILDLIDDFRPPKNQRTARQNIQKQIQNDFVKFLRWSSHKLTGEHLGILAFVLPGSFLEHISYTYARKWLIENFSNIWVISFDSDGRTRAPTSNLFDTLQGRCVIFCSRKDHECKTNVINYFSITDMTKQEKLEFLIKTNKKMSKTLQISNSFATVTVSKQTGYAFKPMMSYDEKSYSRFWALAPTGKTNDERYIFTRHSSGIKLGITAALIHPDHNILNRRTRDVGDLKIDYDSLKERWFTGQTKPPRESNLSPSIRKQIYDDLQTPGSKKFVKQYSFRPFINSYAFLSENTLKKLAREGGGGTRYRPEVVAAYRKSDNYGISVAPSPANLGDHIQRFASFCWHLPDNDLCTRGNGHIFCLKFPDYKTKSSWQPKPINNINPKIKEALIQKGCKQKTIDEDILFYVYGVLASNLYLDSYEGALFKTGGMWPRIPISSDINAFNKISELGKSLAELEKDTQPPKNIFKILPFNGIKLRSFSLNKDSSSITLIDYEGNCFLLKNFQKDCMSYEIGGYVVFNEWLKRQTWPYLRKHFTNDLVGELYLLNNRIKQQFDIIDKIDSLLRTIFKSGNLL